MVQNGPLLVKTSSEGNVNSIPVRMKDTLFRIGQEAIANAVRHANASVLSIRVQCDHSRARLTIQDDGVGFVTHGDSAGFGLIGMRKRADSI